jgi:enamine deaminase RidA (YjgF/YER057c/UK114 family)
MNSLVLAAVLSLSSLGAEAAEIAKYDEGPFSGPYSESARVGDLLFLAGQVGEYEDENWSPAVSKPKLSR